MNFLTAEVQIVVDYSKLQTQLAKVKQEVMKSTIVMEKSYRKQNKAVEIVNKSLVATATFTRQLFGQTVKVEKVLGRWSTLALNFYRKMTRNLLILEKVWSVTKSVAVTLAKPLIWFGKEMYTGFRETKHFGKTIKEIEKGVKGINKEYKVWSMFDVLTHPIKALKAMKKGWNENEGAIDMMNDSLKDSVEKMSAMAAKSTALRYAPPSVVLDPSGAFFEVFMDRQKDLEQKMYDISGVAVIAFKKIYDTAKWAFGGILNIITSTFQKIMGTSIWVKTGVIAAFVGMYYKVTQAAMDAEDALSFNELGPTRTILQQMYDAFTNIAAVIGKPFLTNIRAVASAVTDWLEESTPKIAEWAEKWVSKLQSLEFAFIDWIKFLQEDWKGGITVALKVVAELFKGLGDVLILTMEYVGRVAAKTLMDTFIFGIESWLPKATRVADEKLKRFGRWLLKKTDPSTRAASRWTGIPLGRTEYQRKQVVPRQPTEEEGLSQKIIQAAKKRAENITKILEDMPTWGGTEEKAAENAEKQIKKSAKMMEATGDAMAQHRAKMLEEGGKLAEMELRLSVERINQMMEEDFFARFQRGIAQMKVDFITWGDIGQTVAETMKSSFADAFYAMTTEGRKWKDAMKSFARDVLIAIQKSLAARTAGMIMTGAVGPVMNWLGGLFGLGGAVPTQATGINPTASPVSLQHGGEVTQTGWAKVHKGETYSGVGNGSKPTVVNITKIGTDFETEVDDFEQMDEHVVNIVVRDIVGGGKLAQLTGAS